MFKLVHLSDIHLPPLPGPRAVDLMNKRVLGYINWRRKRLHVHLRSILDTVTTDALAQNPDHIAVTGDLTNLGLPQEFAAAYEWLKSVGDADTVTVIPGNHDAYVRLWRDEGYNRWKTYMAGNDDTRNSPSTPPHRFPFVRVYGEVALIGLSSAITTLPFCAYGRLGNRQRQALAQTLADLRQRDLFRIILIHHPPLPGLTSPRRALRDAHALQTLLEDEGAELVLFGHNHKWSADLLHSASSTTHIVQAPSASQGTLEGYPLAGYNMFTIEKTGSAWEIAHQRRGLETPEGPVVELSSTILQNR